MDIVTLLTNATVAGLRVAVDGGNLQVTGPNTSAATAIVGQLAQRKAEVIAAKRDLTSFVGETVDAATWTALQQRLTLPDYEGWTLQAHAEGEGWHIYRLHMAALEDEQGDQWLTSDFESFGF